MLGGYTRGVDRIQSLFLLCESCNRYFSGFLFYVGKGRPHFSVCMKQTHTQTKQKDRELMIFEGEGEGGGEKERRN